MADNANLTVRRSVLRGTSAGANQGAAIAPDARQGDSGRGGAVFAGAQSVLVMEDVVFSNSSAGFEGGAVFLGQGGTWRSEEGSLRTLLPVATASSASVIRTPIGRTTREMAATSGSWEGTTKTLGGATRSTRFRSRCVADVAGGKLGRGRDCAPIRDEAPSLPRPVREALSLQQRRRMCGCPLCRFATVPPQRAGPFMCRNRPRLTC